MRRFGIVVGHRVGQMASSPAELREVLGDPGSVDVPPTYLPAGESDLSPDAVRSAAGAALAAGDRDLADGLYHLAAVSGRIEGPRLRKKATETAALAEAARRVPGVALPRVTTP